MPEQRFASAAAIFILLVVARRNIVGMGIRVSRPADALATGKNASNRRGGDHCRLFRPGIDGGFQVMAIPCLTADAEQVTDETVAVGANGMPDFPSSHCRATQLAPYPDVAQIVDSGFIFALEQGVIFSTYRRDVVPDRPTRVTEYSG